MPRILCLVATGDSGFGIWLKLSVPAPVLKEQRASRGILLQVGPFSVCVHREMVGFSRTKACSTMQYQVITGENSKGEVNVVTFCEADPVEKSCVPDT